MPCASFPVLGYFYCVMRASQLRVLLNLNKWNTPLFFFCYSFFFFCCHFSLSLSRWLCYFGRTQTRMDSAMTMPVPVVCCTLPKGYSSFCCRNEWNVLMMSLRAIVVYWVSEHHYPSTKNNDWISLYTLLICMRLMCTRHYFMHSYNTRSSGRFLWCVCLFVVLSQCDEHQDNCGRTNQKLQWQRRGILLLDFMQKMLCGCSMSSRLLQLHIHHCCCCCCYSSVARSTNFIYFAEFDFRNITRQEYFQFCFASYAQIHKHSNCVEYNIFRRSLAEESLQFRLNSGWYYNFNTLNRVCMFKRLQYVLFLFYFHF